VYRLKKKTSQPSATTPRALSESWGVLVRCARSPVASSAWLTRRVSFRGHRQLEPSRANRRANPWRMCVPSMEVEMGLAVMVRTHRRCCGASRLLGLSQTTACGQLSSQTRTTPEDKAVHVGLGPDESALCQAGGAEVTTVPKTKRESFRPFWKAPPVRERLGSPSTLFQMKTQTSELAQPSCSHKDKGTYLRRLHADRWLRGRGGRRMNRTWLWARG